MRRLTAIAGVGVILGMAILAPTPSARAENTNFMNVRFRSPYTHKQAQARVAIRHGRVTCAQARTVIRKALSARRNETGQRWYWSAKGWTCSSAGDATVTFCARGRRKVEATTPGGVPISG